MRSVRREFGPFSIDSSTAHSCRSGAGQQRPLRAICSDAAPAAQRAPDTSALVSQLPAAEAGDAVALGISSVLGGVGSDWFQPSSRSAARLLRLAHEAHPPVCLDDGGVTVMFRVPGDLARPGFVGMRAGRLSRQARGLVVEVGVPDRVESPDAFVGTTLVEAIEFADNVFARKRVTADLRRARQIAFTVATQLSRPKSPGA